MLITRSRKELFASSLGYCKKIPTVGQSYRGLNFRYQKFKKIFFLKMLIFAGRAESRPVKYWQDSRGLNFARPAKIYLVL